MVIIYTCYNHKYVEKASERRSTLGTTLEYMLLEPYNYVVVTCWFENDINNIMATQWDDISWSIWYFLYTSIYLFWHYLGRKNCNIQVHEALKTMTGLYRCKFPGKRLEVCHCRDRGRDFPPQHYIHVEVSATSTELLPNTKQAAEHGTVWHTRLDRVQILPYNGSPGQW